MNRRAGASATTLRMEVRMEVMQGGGATGLKPGTRVAVKRFTNHTLKSAGLEVSYHLCGFAAVRNQISSFVTLCYKCKL